MPQQRINMINFVMLSYLIPVGLLVWAFGSYGMYILFDNPELETVCQPWLDSCATISHAGEVGQVGAIFFRATILPLTAVMLIYAIMMKTHFQNLGYGKHYQRTIAVGLLVLAIVSLLLSESILSGPVRPTMEMAKLHGLFAILAFLLMFMGQTMAGYIVFSNKKTMHSICLFLLPAVTVVTYFVATVVIGKTRAFEWALLESIIIWFILFIPVTRR